jgi:hypothetical protein
VLTAASVRPRLSARQKKNLVCVEPTVGSSWQKTRQADRVQCRRCDKQGSGPFLLRICWEVHSQRIGFSVTAPVTNTEADLRFLIWSLSRLLCCVVLAPTYECMTDLYLQVPTCDVGAHAHSTTFTLHINASEFVCHSVFILRMILTITAITSGNSINQLAGLGDRDGLCSLRDRN